jgi:hypothetical protein
LIVVEPLDDVKDFVYNDVLQAFSTITGVPPEGSKATVVDEGDASTPDVVVVSAGEEAHDDKTMVIANPTTRPSRNRLKRMTRNTDGLVTPPRTLPHSAATAGRNARMISTMLVASTQAPLAITSPTTGTTDTDEQRRAQGDMRVQSSSPTAPASGRGGGVMAPRLTRP